MKLFETEKTGLGTIGLGRGGRAGRAGRAGSEMWGVLLVPSSSPTLSPIYDGLDVSVALISRDFTSTIIWFHVESINCPSTEGAPLHRASLRTSLVVLGVDVWKYQLNVNNIALTLTRFPRGKVVNWEKSQQVCRRWGSNQPNQVSCTM